MYIVLKYRDSSSLYTKDDIWIISKSINFEPRTTFVAKSMFYGPSSSGDLEIEPISGYSPSNWRSGDTVHAIWACNAGTELSCIQNLDDYATLQQMPLLPYIMNGSRPSYSSQRTQRHSFSAPLSGVMDRNSLGISWQVIEQETEEMIALHKLNKDQAAALRSCAKMFLSENEDRMECLPITLIHGVFGAGKSFLLAVVVLLMVRLFEIADASDEARTRPITWKILISSTTNVAVDRILLGLLDLGFDQFVRVGSVRKIAKPVLPFSIHSTGTELQELKELQGMLKTELTSSEKAYVRKSIEMHKLGENRKRLANVRVVGVTCAACTFAALERLKFPVLLLDECSQMTEPTSLLPMARFGCRKLVLVGDPKQLNPTIQGSEPSHESGLEQTLFDRLIKMDLKPILLRKQYRCHPVISSLSNRLFYNDRLLDGVNAEEREPLVDFVPTLCFYNVSNGREECSQDGSYFNSAEAKFVVVLIKSLLESEVEPKQIGVITQYKSQLTTITSSLSADGGTSHKEWAGIQISTVDAFQGGEKDVIILSCVRTKHIGFIDCERRTNVALTRAKRHLCIVGCGKILSSNSLWSKILTFCRESPEGFQSSVSYIKRWNERRPKVDDNFTEGTSSKPKKPRKSRKSNGGKRTFKPSNEPEAHAQDCPVETEATPSCDSSSNKTSELIPVQEIFDSEPIFDNENTYSDQISDIVDNGDVYGISDKPDAIEISDNPEAPRNDIPYADGKIIEISGNNDCSDDVRKDLQKEITVVEKEASDSESNCSDFLFGDDSLMDDELCTLDF
ncbi:ZGRF1 isoform X2 [Paramuricea clavata]|uniref:ZGRF1 isoform X2 n=1 Tax=Paramuricea clavata TaxID=317549 RepID=A0A7D9ESK8_PARCT|nr:ZGRF1 isoform X2 [Paramuricea clavata]